MSEPLVVNELFRSIQGESTFAGRICSFVRLAGCNLDCSWCDTSYAARPEGTLMSIEAIVAAVKEFAAPVVEITGGEPLLQPGTAPLARALGTCFKTVLVQTNGSRDVGVLPSECIRIVDVKCPSSGMEHSFLESNLALLTPLDEVKFVIGSRGDFDFAVAFIERHALQDRVLPLFSPVAGTVPPADLAQWILDSNAPVRLQVQLHKILWGDRRGV